MSDRAPPSVPLAPGNYDRAWNDPPLFSYSQSASGAPTNSTGRTALNKRVGFPSGGPSSLPASSGPPRLHDAGAKPPSSMLPGPPQGGMPPPPVAHIDTTKNTIEDPVTVIKTCDEVEVTLSKIARENFPTKKCDDLLVRLSVLFSAWRSDTLKPRVKILISEISSLLDEDVERLCDADQKLVTLSADHGSEANNTTWILAVRHILLKLREGQQKGEIAAVTAPL